MWATPFEVVAMFSLAKSGVAAVQARLKEVEEEKKSWDTILPIFFYNDTLFPFSPLALYLFEPRYKVLEMAGISLPLHLFQSRCWMISFNLASPLSIGPSCVSLTPGKRLPGSQSPGVFFNPSRHAQVMLHRIVESSRKFAYVPKFGAYEVRPLLCPVTRVVRCT
jgi:hypothetical protein